MTAKTRFYKDGSPYVNISFNTSPEMLKAVDSFADSTATDTNHRGDAIDHLLGLGLAYDLMTKEHFAIKFDRSCHELRAVNYKLQLQVCEIELRKLKSNGQEKRASTIDYWQREAKTARIKVLTLETELLNLKASAPGKLSVTVPWWNFWS